MFTQHHRYFVQYMLKNGAVTKTKALKFLSKITSDVSDLEQLKEFLSTINKQISENNFKLFYAICEVTGEELMLLLNTRDDDVSKLQRTFTPIELEYFQVLLRTIVTSKEKCLLFSISSNLASTLTSHLSKTDAYHLLTKWIKGGYFVKDGGRVYLGARCLYEYASYFHEHCEDYFTTCSLCSESVFMGITCESCENDFHKHCVHKFLQKKKMCPHCKNVWIQPGLNDSFSQ